MLELNHPNIIKLLDFFEKKDHFYMVVEKVRGEERNTYTALPSTRMIVLNHNACLLMFCCCGSGCERDASVVICMVLWCECRFLR